LSATWSLKEGRSKGWRRLRRKESYGYEELKVKTLMKSFMVADTHSSSAIKRGLLV
jgi:hypothetical protein